MVDVTFSREDSLEKSGDVQQLKSRFGEIEID